MNSFSSKGAISKHFGLRRQSEAATAFFRAGVILDRRKRTPIDSRCAQKVS